MTELFLMIAGTTLMLVGCGKLVSTCARAHRESRDELREAELRFAETSDRVLQIQRDARQLARSKVAWEGWKPLEVFRTEVESQDCKSIYLRSADGEPLPSYRPGQYLIVSLRDANGADLRRCYSLSDVADPDQFRLTVKRVPGGRASTEIVESLEAGAIVQAQAPRGKFVIDENASTPVTLIAAGIGITPMVAFAKHLERWNPRRPVQLFYQFRDIDQAPLLQDVAKWAANHDRARLYCFVSRPRQALPRWAFAQERVSPERILQCCDATSSAEYATNPREGVFLICGPGPMVQRMREGFVAAGIAAENVISETFGVSSGTAQSEPNLPEDPNDNSATEYRVALAGSNTTFACSDSQSILEAAEAAGVDLPSGCRMGDCGECALRCVRGNVQYAEPPSYVDLQEGEILSCVANPASDIELSATEN